MLMLQKMHALGILNSASGGSYVASAVDFDGVNDYMTRGAALTGAANNSQGIFCCWFRRDGGTGSVQRIFHESSGKMEVYFDASNKIVIEVQDAAGSASLKYVSTTAITDSNWHSLLMSWDANFSAGNKLIKIAVDDASYAGTVTDASSAFTVDYTQTNWTVGAQSGLWGTKWDGCLAEVYFAMAQYLDFSNSTNRRLFVSALNKPVDLGADGSTPTGVQPIVYFNDTAASFGTNKGSGGNFTITGTLDTASSSPSD